MSSTMYCSLSDVKRLLRSVSTKETKIRFSEAYKNLKADRNNSGEIALSGVVFDDSFAENETYTFEFLDSTSFEVSGEVIGYLGTGDRSQSFTASGKFTIPPANWSGLAEAGDLWYITAASDISNEDGEAFILDASKKIRSQLNKIFGSEDDYSFDETPDAISYACIRLTAYEIFNSLFAGMSTDGDSPVEFWKDEANETLNEYLSSHGPGPRWKARSSLITTIGISNVGEGELDISNIPDAKNKQYER